MMKKIALAATVAAAALAATPALAAAPTANGTATVRLFSALTITADEPAMDFGAVVRESTYTTATTISLDASTGDVTCGTNLVCSGATKASAYSVTGDNDASVEIAIGGADFDATLGELSLKGPAGSDDLIMTFSPSSDLAAIAGDDPDDYKLVLDGSGDGSFTLGGTLTVPVYDATTAPNGTYTGSYTLTANYL